MHRVSRRLVLLPVLAVSVLGMSAIGAEAKVTPKGKSSPVIITGGSTTLTATTATVTFLTAHNVTVAAIAPATMSGASVTLPVVGGVATTKKLNAILLHRGAVRFVVGKLTLTVRHITLAKFNKHARLDGIVAGKVVRLGNISDLVVTAKDKTATATGELHLSAAVAHLINKLLGKHVVSTGFDFGSFTSTLTLG